MGGKGAKASGIFTFKEATKLFICIGGNGTNHNGYNGGGRSNYGNSTGGGCSSVSLISGTVASIGETNRDSLLVVAGGGGGNAYYEVEGGSSVATRYLGLGGNGGRIGSDGTGATFSYNSVDYVFTGGKGGSTLGGGLAGTGVFLNGTSTSWPHSFIACRWRRRWRFLWRRRRILWRTRF